MDYTKDTLTLEDGRVCEDRCQTQGSGYEGVPIEHREQFLKGVQGLKGINPEGSQLIIPSQNREPSVSSNVHKEYDMEFSMLEESGYQPIEDSESQIVRSSIYEDKNDLVRSSIYEYKNDLGRSSIYEEKNDIVRSSVYKDKNILERVTFERSNNRHPLFYCDESASTLQADDPRKPFLLNSVSGDIRHTSNETFSKESSKFQSDENCGFVVSDFLPKTPEAHKCLERDLEDSNFNCQGTSHSRSYDGIDNITKHSHLEEVNFQRAQNSLKVTGRDEIYEENLNSNVHESSCCQKTDFLEDRGKVAFENSLQDTGGIKKSQLSTDKSFSERMEIGRAAAALASMHKDVITAKERVVNRNPGLGYIETVLTKNSLRKSAIFVEPGIEENDSLEISAHTGMLNELKKSQEYSHFDEDNAKSVNELSKKSPTNDSLSHVTSTKTICDFQNEHMDIADHSINTSQVNKEVESENEKDRMEGSAESSSDQSNTDEKNFSAEEDTILIHSTDSQESPPVGARRRFKCKLCNLSWKLRKDLKNHLKTHKEVAQFSCSVCNSSFINRILLKKHLLTHANNNLFPCSDCPTTCNSLLDLTHHKRIHDTAPSLSCTECSYVAKHKKALTKHMVVHSTLKVYNCQLCKFSSKRKYSLQRHLKTAHYSAEVYECSMCNFKTNSVESAKEHVAKHVCSQTKSCIICGAVVQKGKKFIDHFLNHSNDNDVNCEECFETYTTGSEYILHLLSHKEITSHDPEKINQSSVLDNSTLALLNGRIDSALGSLGFLPLKSRLIMDTPTMEAKLSQMSTVSSRLADMTKVVSLLNEKSKVFCQLTEVSKLATELAVISGNVLQSYKNTYRVTGGTSASKTKTLCPLVSNEVSEDTSGADDEFEMTPELNMPAVSIKEELQDGSFPLAEAGMQIQVDLNGEAVSCIQKEDSYRQSKSKGGKYFKCPRCNLTCTDSRSLKRHLLVHDDVRPYSCEKCGQSFRRNEHLKKHMVTHTDERPFVCEECPYAAKTEHRLKIHALCHSQTRSFACQHCTYTGRTNYELNHHMKRHEPRSCSQCNFICYSRGEMKKHVFTHSSFGCSECDYTTSDKAEYTKHIKRHSVVQHLCCELCGYSCDTMKKFKYHKLRHENKTPYQCPDCDYKCSSRASFDCHRLKHAGLKPYLCSFCGASFRKTSHLNQHLLIHKDEKAFKCNECGYSCRTKHNLKEHEMTHSGEKPFACKYCSFSCRRNKALQLHMLKHENTSMMIPQLQMPSLQYSHLQMPLQMPMIPSGQLN